MSSHSPIHYLIYAVIGLLIGMAVYFFLLWSNQNRVLEVTEEASLTEQGLTGKELRQARTDEFWIPEEMRSYNESTPSIAQHHVSSIDQLEQLDNIILHDNNTQFRDEVQQHIYDRLAGLVPDRSIVDEEAYAKLYNLAVGQTMIDNNRIYHNRFYEADSCPGCAFVHTVHYSYPGGGQHFDNPLHADDHDHGDLTLDDHGISQLHFDPNGRYFYYQSVGQRAFVILTPNDEYTQLQKTLYYQKEDGEWVQFDYYLRPLTPEELADFNEVLYGQTRATF